MFVYFNIVSCIILDKKNALQYKFETTQHFTLVHHVTFCEVTDRTYALNLWGVLSTFKKNLSLCLQMSWYNVMQLKSQRWYVCAVFCIPRVLDDSLWCVLFYNDIIAIYSPLHRVYLNTTKLGIFLCCRLQSAGYWVVMLKPWFRPLKLQRGQRQS